MRKHRKAIVIALIVLAIPAIVLFFPEIAYWVGYLAGSLSRLFR